jgi:hypothetical protein
VFYQAVIVYNDGSPADVLAMDLGKLQHFWKLWLQRLNLFRSQKDFENPLSVQNVEI